MDEMSYLGSGEQGFALEDGGAERERSASPYSEEEDVPAPPPRHHTYQDNGIESPEDDLNEEESLEAVRGSWQFASLIQFCRMFAVPLKVKNFSADFLEKALMAPNDYHLWLAELCYKLLETREQCNRQETWEKMLHDKMIKQWWDCFETNPLRTKGFFEVTPMKRVRSATKAAVRILPLTVFDQLVAIALGPHLIRPM
jgi:hypothetical protein